MHILVMTRAENKRVSVNIQCLLMPVLKIGAVLTFARISWVKVSLMYEHRVNSRKVYFTFMKKYMRILGSR